MPRIRSIHYDACKSDKLDRASAEAERCYWRLQPWCDDDGRAEDDPRLLRSELFPLSDTILAAAVDEWLDELHALGLIVRYEVEGRQYLEVTHWADYQHPQKRIPSTIPPISESTTVRLRDSYGSPTVVVEPGVGVGVGVGEGVKDMSAPPTAAQVSRVSSVSHHEFEFAQHGIDVDTAEALWAVADHVGPLNHATQVRDQALELRHTRHADEVETVFAVWQHSTGHHRAVLDKKRRACITRALQSYPCQDLEDACRGVLMVAHNRGETNGTRYDALELVLRDAEHIERFRDRYRAGPAVPSGLGGLAAALASERTNGEVIDVG